MLNVEPPYEHSNKSQSMSQQLQVTSQLFSLNTENLGRSINMVIAGHCYSLTLQAVALP